MLCEQASLSKFLRRVLQYRPQLPNPFKIIQLKINVRNVRFKILTSLERQLDGIYYWSLGSIKAVCVFWTIYASKNEFIYPPFYDQEHEFVRNHLGVIFAVAANNPNPLEAFRNLTQIQQKQQQDNRASSYPQYLSANIMKYYVLVSSVSISPMLFTAY